MVGPAGGRIRSTSAEHRAETGMPFGDRRDGFSPSRTRPCMCGDFVAGGPPRRRLARPLATMELPDDGFSPCGDLVASGSPATAIVDRPAQNDKPEVSCHAMRLRGAGWLAYPLPIAETGMPFGDRRDGFFAVTRRGVVLLVNPLRMTAARRTPREFLVHLQGTSSVAASVILSGFGSQPTPRRAASEESVARLPERMLRPATPTRRALSGSRP